MGIPPRKTLLRDATGDNTETIKRMARTKSCVRFNRVHKAAGIISCTATCMFLRLPIKAILIM